MAVICESFVAESRATIPRVRLHRRMILCA